jgi:transcription initiation factor IIF auxiliary subunit
LVAKLNIEIKDTVFDPNLPRSSRNKVQIREEKGTTYYKVWLYLEGEDLPYVESVTYSLHETFRNPNRTVRRTPSNPNCQLVIWTWGVFTVGARIVDKRDLTYELSQRLEYDKQLPSEEDLYDYGDSSSNKGAKLVPA